MNSVPLAVTLLERQFTLAREADTEFEKAAVFAATTALFQYLDSEIGEADYLGEKLEQARWFICAMVGYEIDNGLDVGTIRSGALSALSILRDGLVK